MAEPLDNWTIASMAIGAEVSLAIQNKDLTAPVEVHIFSVRDEPLEPYRLAKLSKFKPANKNVFELLQADEPRWQDSDIFPITAIVTDAGGKSQEWIVDLRPKKIN